LKITKRSHVSRLHICFPFLPDDSEGRDTLLHRGETYQIEPARADSLIRDLVFDFDPP
jgi:hypothetical protein